MLTCLFQAWQSRELPLKRFGLVSKSQSYTHDSSPVASALEHCYNTPCFIYHFLRDLFTIPFTLEIPTFSKRHCIRRGRTNHFIFDSFTTFFRAFVIYMIKASDTKKHNLLARISNLIFPFNISKRVPNGKDKYLITIRKQFVIVSITVRNLKILLS
jgi:hypothetical protein